MRSSASDPLPRTPQQGRTGQSGPAPLPRQQPGDQHEPTPSRSEKEARHFHPFDLVLDGRDIAECFDRMVLLRLDSGLQMMEVCARQELATRSAVIDLLRRSLQLVLYLCAVNAEIVPDPEQRTTMRRTSGPPKDRYAEVRKWDAGFRVGAAIRAQTPGPASTSEARPAGAQTPKRPHMRRGHWHHFWIGPKSDPARRRLILKWLPPIFVDPAGEELPVVIHAINPKEDVPPCASTSAESAGRFT